jgi:ribonuclease J
MRRPEGRKGAEQGPAATRRDFQRAEPRALKNSQPRTASPKGHGAGGDAFQAIPLGGVGEVGKNSTLYRSGGEYILVDAGVMFPEEEILGIDAVIPDFSHIAGRADALRGIVVTHGHEDHIGALTYAVAALAGKAALPIYGSRLTLGLVRAKLAERNLLAKVDLREVHAGQRLRLGRFDLEFLAVGHSIPDALAIVFHTSLGAIVHTGDWKFAGMPQATRDRLRQLGDAGVHTLLADCVRIESAGYSGDEDSVVATLEGLIKAARGRVIVTSFASHLERIGKVITMAHRLGRVCALAGRSMDRNIAIAAELGYLNVPEGALVHIDETRHFSADKIVLIMTGSQGEPNAALSRIALGEHRTVKAARGDTVIFSAHPIPGNEGNVSKVIDNLFRLGCDVYYPAITPGLHVSGHAGRDEHAELLDILRPHNAVPLHGEFRMMTLYSRLAVAHGVAEQRVVLPELGSVIDFGAAGTRLQGKVAAGSVLVDGNAVGLDAAVLLDRAHLAGDGIVIVSVTVDKAGRLLHAPEIVSRGLPSAFLASLTQGASAKVAKLVGAAGARDDVGRQGLAERIGQAVGPLVHRHTGLQPLILPLVRQV